MANISGVAGACPGEQERNVLPENEGDPADEQRASETLGVDSVAR